ncbi:MAG: hypothetical protein J6T04_06080 [Bacteroidales bacterium]|nr:hypothetical protein [Bacteroidales bacterium]
MRYINIHFYILLFSATFFLSVCKSSAQDSLSIPKSLEERYDAFARILSPEKVYLHSDKDVYAIGDTIWFKGYVANASALSEYPESRFIYVELVGSTYSRSITSGRYEEMSYVMQRVKIRYSGGVLQGHIPVPEDANTGYATIRAFTYWNLNEEPDFLFSKTVSIINPVKDNYVEELKEKKLRDNSFYEEIGAGNPFDERKLVPKFDCHFLPESGRLLSGRATRIGVKIINENGLGQQADGKVYNHNNVQVASFSTDEYGFGSFVLTPQSTSEKYYAMVKDVRGTSEKVSLPAVDAEGAAITIKPGKDMMEASMAVSSGLRAEKLRFILCSKDEIYYDEPLDKVLRVNLPTEGMPEGVNNAVICDETGYIYAKRPFFVMPDGKEIKCDLSYETKKGAGKTRFPRQKVNVTVPIEGAGEGGSFSVSVTDNVLAPVNTQNDNIVSYMFLSSEIRGNVENPQRFFCDTIPLEKRIEDVDLMLMTQGWEYYDLPSILSGQYPMPKFGREYVQSISGQVKRGLLKKPKASMVAFLAPSINFAAVGKIDKEGYFELKDLNFPEGTTFIVSATNVNNNRSLKPVIFEDSFAPMTKFIYNREKVKYTPEVSKIFQDNYYNAGGDLSYQLNSITVYGKKKTLSGISPLTNWEFKSDQIREGKRLEPYKSYDLINYLAETCQGLRLDQQDGTRVLLCRVPASASNWSVGNDWVPIKVYMNGLVMSDWMELEGMMMDDVEAVVYLKGIDAAPFTMGEMGYGTSANVSAVLIKTKTTHNVLWHVSYGKPLGWQIPKNFYSPRYDVTTGYIPPQGTDKRSTLYWNPRLKADADGNVRFEFFHSDLPEDNYTITLEGVTADGKLVSKQEALINR